MLHKEFFLKMGLRTSKAIILLVGILFVSQISNAQVLDVNTCPFFGKRSNGNGQASSAAGDFTPAYAQNNPVAANIVGTIYQHVYFDPTTKTGDLTLSWSSATPIINLPVITRVWTIASGSTTPVLTSISFGPPAAPSTSGGSYVARYCYYYQNIPPQGTLILEFSDPQTSTPVFLCSYDLGSGASTTTTVSCAPSITTQPSNTSLCGASSTSFSVVASGVVGYQWQVSSDTTVSANWTNISAGANYTNVTTSTLNIANPTTYDGKYYRVVLTGSSGCGNTNSYAALLSAKPKPTATFATASVCGTGTQSLAVTLTGTAPWSITYTVGGTPVTKSNITSSPYYISASGSTAYVITNVSDAYCTNGTPTGIVTSTLYPAPIVAASNVSVCVGSSSFNLNFSSTGSPDQYTLTAGVRAMAGFSTITNASLISPYSVSKQTSVVAGVYDFILVVRNSTTGCVSASMPFTVTVSDLPIVGASAASSSICAGTNATLTASPSNLSSYAWTVSPSATVLSTSISYTPTVSITTTYTLTGTNASGCSASANVTVTAVQGAPISISPTSTTICPGNATTLTASGANSYSWSPSTGLSSTIDDQVVASPSSTTTYTVIGSNLTGCQSSSTVTVTVNTVPLSVTASATICTGATKTLTASGASTYIWYPVTGLYTDAGATTAYTGTSLATVYSKPTATTTYYVNGTTADGCSGVSSTTVTISAAPVNAATSTPNNVVFCAPSVTTLPINVVMTEAVTSATWSYSTDNITYTSFTVATSPGGVTLTPSTSGSSPTVTYTCTLSAMGNSGYSGPRYLRLTIVGSICTFTYNVYLTDTKASSAANPAPAPSASQTTICNGNSITLTIGALGTGATAQWQSSPNGTTWTDISLATSASYTASPTANTYYKVVYNGGNGSCGGVTASTLITVVSALTANTVTPSTTCTTGSGTFTLTGTAITNGVYQWQISTTSNSAGFSDILGATSQNYTLPTNIVSTITWYKRVASNGICFSNTSAAVAVYPPISNNKIITATTSYCNGSAPSITLSGDVPVGGDATYSYQWKYSTDGSVFNNVPSAGLTKDYVTAIQTQTYWYKRVVSSGGCALDESSVIRIVVNANPTVSVTPSTTLCSGTNLTLTASGANSYTWSPSTFLSATTGSSVLVTPTATTSYTVIGTDVNGCSNTASTTITVTSLPTTPVLSSFSATVCSGSVNLNSYITSGGTTEWFTAPEAKAAYAVSTPTSVSTAGTYYVFAKSGSCYSLACGTFTLTTANVAKPVVASTTVSLCSPATADLTSLQPAASSGTSLEWHTVSSNPTPGDLVGAPANTTAGTGTYYLYAYSSGGSCFGPASDAVAVTINSLTNASVSSTSASVCSPNKVDLTSYNNTSGTNTYKWYSTNNPIADNLVGVPSQVSQSGTYYLYATNAAGCTGAASSGVVVTVNIKPTATLNAPTAVCAGAASTITGSSTSGATYAWQYSSNGGTSWASVTNGGVYSGATTNTLSISNTTGLGGYYYQYTVTSAASCSVTSDPAILISEAAPAISTQPSNSSVALSGNTSFSVAISGNFSANYQWQVSTDGGTNYTNLSNGAPYSGTDLSTLVITSATAGLSTYKYKCVITNSCNTLTSDAATLSVGSTCPTTSNAGADQTGAATCGLTTVTLAGNTPTVGTGAWSIVSGTGGTITDPSSATSTFTGTAGSTYTLRWTISNSPCAASTDDVVITFNQNPTTANAGADQNGAATCGQTSVTLAANAPTVGTGAWSIVSGTGGTITTASSATSTFTGTAGSTYTLRWTISNSPCTASTDDVVITFNQNPTTANAGADQNEAATCGQTSVTLAGNAPTVGTGAWSIVSGTGGTITTASSATSTFTGTAGSSYTLRWTITNSPCTASTDDVVITFNQNPSTANAGADQTGAATCGQTSVTLAGNAPLLGTGSWSIVSGSGGTITDPGSATSTFTGASGSSYTLRWTISKSPCTASTDDVVITFNQNPTTANAGADQTGTATCGQTSVTLAGNTPSIGTGAWSIVSGTGGTIGTASSATSTFTGTAGSTYTLRWTISNPCTASTDDVVITFNQKPSISSAPAASQLIATGNTVTLSVTATDAASSLWYKDGVSTGSTGSSYVITTLTQTNGGSYTIKLTAANGCEEISSAYVITPSIVLYSKSTGNLNVASNWGVNADGTGSTPVDFTRDEHTFVVANRLTAATGGNLIIAGTLDTRNGVSTITAGTLLKSGVITRSSGSGTLAGTTTSDLVITGISGSSSPSNLYFDQATPGNNVLRDISVNNIVVNVQNALNITAGNATGTAGTVFVNSGTLASAGNLTLKSNVNGTARVSQASNTGGYITGAVTVERYLAANSNRAWRLLSIPTTGSQTFHEAWQEGAAAVPNSGDWAFSTNPNPGYGTNITTNNAGGLSAGYDYITPFNSLLYFNPPSNAWVPVPSANAAIETRNGYFIYIRGDRTMTPSSSTLLITPTTLRTKGPLYQGDQTALSVPDGMYTLVGNPYASIIDLKALSKTGVDNSVYIWDPKLTGSYGIGAFQIFTYNGSDFVVTPGGGSYGSAGSTVNSIQSGQAFFMRGSTGGGSVTFKEDCKVTGSGEPGFTTTAVGEQMITSLYVVTAGGNVLADGTFNMYAPVYSNNIDADDARKMTNSSENFGMIRNGIGLGVEKKQLIGATDTIYYNMNNLKQMGYQLVFVPNALNHPGLLCKLVDSYSGSSIPVSLSDTTKVDFSVNATAASYAANRFKLVYYSATTLPVGAVTALANIQSKQIQVQWNATNQIDMQQYEVERSADGVTYKKMQAIPAIGFNGSNQNYNWTDANPMPGNNFYRIRCVDLRSEIKYSNVVKIAFGETISGIEIYPNPVLGHAVSLLFTNMQKGDYSIRVMSNSGQTVMSKKIAHYGGSAVKSFVVANVLSREGYYLDISTPEGTKMIRKLIFE